MRFLSSLFGRRWWWSTLLVIAGMIVMARLGIWQLDRLDQRRAENARIQAQLATEVLELSATTIWPSDVSELKDRRVFASGRFDHEQQLVLVQQRYQNELGYHLVTPLVLPDGDTAVLVDRGWIPPDYDDAEAWAQFDGDGPVLVNGYAQLTQNLPNGEVIIPTSPLSEWFRVDITAIANQLPYQLLPVYILEAPDGVQLEPPYRVEPDLSLSEGNHLSYAIQWFSFALLFAGGYVIIVRRADKATADPDPPGGTDP